MFNSLNLPYNDLKEKNNQNVLFSVNIGISIKEKLIRPISFWCVCVSGSALKFKESPLISVSLSLISPLLCALYPQFLGKIPAD
jgi:hypothetical protein